MMRYSTPPPARRSPSPPGRGRTRIGSRIPLSRIDWTRSSRSPMAERGWPGSGSMAESGIILPIGVSCRAVSSSTKWVSWRIFTRTGRPRLRAGSDTAQHLLGKTVVLVSSGRPRGKGEDGLAVGGALFQPDTLGDHRLEDLDPEHPLDLLVDVLGQQSPLVVHGDEGSQNLELGVGPHLDLVDRLQQVVGPLQGEVACLDGDQ